MKSYVVVDRSARLGPGTVMTLTAAQLADRRRNVEVMVEDAERAIVRTLAHVEFKAGETIEMEGEPPKAVAAVVLSPEQAAARAEAAAQAEAAKKASRARSSRSTAKRASRAKKKG